MAFTPGIIPLAFLSVRMRWGLAVSFTITAAVIGSTITGFPGIASQTLTLPAFRELQSFQSSLPRGNVIIVARHGLEWWTAWAMNVKITNNIKTVMNTWDKYDAVLVLEEINSSAFTGGDRIHPGGPGGRPSPFSVHSGFNGPSHPDNADGFPIMPDSPGFQQGGEFHDKQRGPGGPGATGFQADSDRPGRGGRPGGRGLGPDIVRLFSQDILETIEEGSYFRLRRITEKPDGEMYGEYTRH
jgi:hypothetical protein